MLLEKKGKSTEQLNNLRLITQIKCDPKLRTRTLVDRRSKVMIEIIHELQIAYIPGRNVQNYFKKPQSNQTTMQEKKKTSCRSGCKKDFDSVNHKYMLGVLDLAQNS
jgi:hypothetical protein